MATLQTLVLASSLGFHIFALAHPSPLDNLTSLSPQIVHTSIGGTLSQPVSSSTSSTEQIPSTSTTVDISSQPNPNIVSLPQITASPPLSSSPSAASGPTPPSVSTVQEVPSNNPTTSRSTTHRLIVPDIAETKTMVEGILPASAPSASQTASTTSSTSAATPLRLEPGTETLEGSVVVTSVPNDIQETSPAVTKTRVDVPTAIVGGPNAIAIESSGTATSSNDMSNTRTLRVGVLIPQIKATAQNLLPDSETAVGAAGQTDTPASPGYGGSTAEQTLFAPQTKTLVGSSAVTKTTEAIHESGVIKTSLAPPPSAVTKTISSDLTVITVPVSAVIKTTATDLTTLTVPKETYYAVIKTRVGDESPNFRPMQKTSTLNLENPAGVASFELLPIPAGMTPPPTVATEAAHFTAGSTVLPIAGTYIAAGGSSAVIQGTTYSLDASAHTAWVNGVASSVTSSQLSVIATMDGTTTTVPMTLMSPSTPTSTQPIITSSPTRSSTSTATPLAIGASAGRLSALGSSWLGIALLFAI